MNLVRKIHFDLHIKSYQIIRGLAEGVSKVDIGSLVKKNKVVVFMKGVPEEPRCGFSNAVVQILRMHNVNYDAHDVLKDESIRTGTRSPDLHNSFT